MTDLKDGGPAFPGIEAGQLWDENAGRYRDRKYAAPGMSLRDWFAGQALAGLLAHPQITESKWVEFAKSAYKVADAMLKERSQ